jgi:hypothetical protein
VRTRTDKNCARKSYISLIYFGFFEMKTLKEIAPFFSFIGIFFYIYGFYLLLIRELVIDSMFFIIGYILFIYVSVTMDDEWILEREA